MLVQTQAFWVQVVAVPQQHLSNAKVQQLRQVQRQELRVPFRAIRSSFGIQLHVTSRKSSSHDDDDDDIVPSLSSLTTTESSTMDDDDIHGTSPTVSDTSEQQQQQQLVIVIRNCKYAELNAVSDIIVDSFYADRMKSSPFSAVLKLGELNRLQQNFPYDDSQRHVMLVATTTTKSSTTTLESSSWTNARQDDGATKIVGFVDMDARPATRRIDPPRPYISDLAVHPDFRRHGIASQLIQSCEALVCNGNVCCTTTAAAAAAATTMSTYQLLERTNNTHSHKKEMFIRVEQTNTAAIQMYEKFNYRAISHSIFGVEDTTVLLYKEL